MLRASAVFLAFVLVFGLVFALLPEGPALDRSGVTLNDVSLTLYPGQDPQATWRFTARQVRVDPSRDENTLDDLGQGERFVRDAAGRERLDLTLSAPRLTIDAQDNLAAPSAQMYILNDCTSLVLRGTSQQPVRINQLTGYAAPDVRVSSPTFNGEFDDMTSNFDLSNFQASQHPGASLDADPGTRCVNGRVVPKGG